MTARIAKSIDFLEVLQQNGLLNVHKQDLKVLEIDEISYEIQYFWCSHEIVCPQGRGRGLTFDVHGWH